MPLKLRTYKWLKRMLRKKNAVGIETRLDEKKTDIMIDDVRTKNLEIGKGLDHQKEKNVNIMGQVSTTADQTIDTSEDRGQGIEIKIVQVGADMKTTTKMN